MVLGRSTMVLGRFYHCVRKFYLGVRKVYHGVGKVYHGVRNRGLRWVFSRQEQGLYLRRLPGASREMYKPN